MRCKVSFVSPTSTRSSPFAAESSASLGCGLSDSACIISPVDSMIETLAATAYVGPATGSFANVFVTEARDTPRRRARAARVSLPGAVSAA